MRILFFNNGSGLSLGKSGGTTRHLEIAKRLVARGEILEVVTTHGARPLYDECVAIKCHTVRASLVATREKKPLDRAWGYIISTLHAILLIHTLPLVDIVYTTSDYFCDVIPAWFYKFKHPNTRFVAMIHHQCRPPSVRHGRWLTNMVSWLGQQLTHYIINRSANCIFVYDTPEGEKIAAKFIDHKRDAATIMSVWNGISVSTIDKTAASIHQFDACFVGVLRISKGIYDLVSVWKIVCSKLPNARLAIIGDGIPSITREFRRRILNEGLEDRITLLGTLPSEGVYSAMKSSKLLISTSHEEGWGIAVCEALACGIPVVAYYLPAFRIFKKYITQVDVSDHEAMAQVIIQLLNDACLRYALGTQGHIFIRQYDWDRVAEREQALLKAML